jgi:hypothetical protein
MMDAVTDMVCPRCGCREPKTLVHGHYQCDNCKCIADGDCCQGETATAPKTMYRLVSRTGKNLGTYGTRNEAEERERQVMFFKNQKKRKA